MAKTKIFVFQMKELIYTGIFVGLGILLIILLIVMFFPSRDQATSSAHSKYKAGVYNSEITLGDSTINLEVVVDADQIKSVSFINLEESVTTMYPLIQPSLHSIEEELQSGTDLDDIELSEHSKYTQSLLIQGIHSALDQALTDPA